jgi:hypothetical protein
MVLDVQQQLELCKKEIETLKGSSPFLVELKKLKENTNTPLY